MKNLENKNILNVEKNNKKQSVFGNSEVVLNILYNTCPVHLILLKIYMYYKPLGKLI